MILYVDHGLYVSTFAARGTAGTGSDVYSVVVTLTGSFHGRASKKAMKMLYGINSLDEIEEYIQSVLHDNKKIMGFSHCVYGAEDPR